MSKKKRNTKEKVETTDVVIEGDTKDVIKGIPVELIDINEDSGEVCIGDDCFKIKIGDDGIAFEYSPDSQQCSLETRQVAKSFMKQIIEGKPKIKFRKV